MSKRLTGVIDLCSAVLDILQNICNSKGCVVSAFSLVRAYMDQEGLARVCSRHRSHGAKICDEEREGQSS